MVLLPDAFEAFFVGAFMIKLHTAFCFGEKQGMLVNNECSSGYNRVDDF